MPCQHSETIVDFHSADLLCTQCGLVFQSLSGEELGLFGTSNPLNTNRDRQIPAWESHENSVFIQDLLHRLMLPSGCYDRVISKFLKYKKKQSCFRNTCFQKGQKFKGFTDYELATYSCYKALKDMSTPRSLKEISHFSGINTRTLWIIERFLCEPNLPLKPKDVMASYYSKLGFSFEDYKNMCEWINCLGDLNFSPLTQSAYVFYQYSKKNNRKLTMKEVGLVCNVSSMSLYRLHMYIKQNKKHFVMKYTNS